MPSRWNCCVAGCTSNWRNWHNYYYVPKTKVILDYYKAFLKTDGVNWQIKKCICSKHWSVPRRNFKHLPDVRIPGGKRDEAKLVAAKARRARAKKFEKTKKICQRKVSVNPVRSSESESLLGLHLAEQEKSSADEMTKIKSENAKLKLENMKLKSEIENLRFKLTEPIENHQPITDNVPVFDWESLSDIEIEQFTGFSLTNLTTLYHCLEPYLHLLQYEDCQNPMSNRRKTNKKNEFLAVMAICRHALPMNVVAWMLQISQPTLTRIFEAWITLGDVVFSSINLQPSHELLTSMMPSQFKALGFNHVTLILDATEFRVEKFSDLNLNTLFFSDYKQSHTVKALICLTPHGALSQVPDLYPGSITDTDITDVTGALDKCQVLDGILTDKGFGISELAASKGAEHNRPPTKSVDQFTEGQCEENFNIACLRIHVERWIGYLRNFRILNTVWPIGRLDLLNSVWRFLAHIQAISTLVKPKE